MARKLPGRLYPPGTRGNNWSYVYRVCINYQDYEVSTDTDDPRKAEDFAWAFYEEVRSGRYARPKTFNAVAEAYIAAKNPGKNDRRYIKGLKKQLGSRDIASIVQMDIEIAANKLYPTGSPATKNRQVFTSAAAILHFAHENQMRDYIVVRKLREPEPETRLPKDGVMNLLLANTEGKQHLLLLILYSQGWRITETLLLSWDNIDLKEHAFRFWIPKAQRWKWIEMDDAVFEALAAEKGREGRVFAWGDRHNVYRWLKPLCKKLGVKFTPHMARHAFATDLHRHAGANQRDIKDAGSWTSEKSTARYIHADRERTRHLLQVRSADNSGDSPGKKRESK